MKGRLASPVVGNKGARLGECGWQAQPLGVTQEEGAGTPLIGTGRDDPLAATARAPLDRQPQTASRPLEHDANRFGGGMDGGSGRAVVSHGLVVRVLGEDGLSAEDWAACALMRTFVDCGSHQLDDASPIDGRI